MEKKNAINWENAPSQIVVKCLCSRVVEGPIHEVDAQHVIKFSSPQNLINLKLGLSNDSDNLFVEQILGYTKKLVFLSVILAQEN